MMFEKKLVMLVCILSIAMLLTACSEKKGTSSSKNDEVSEVEERTEVSLQMKIEDESVQVDWEDNESVETLKGLCKDEPLVIQMSMYGGYEQVGNIGTSIPENDVEITAKAGDIVLYSGNSLVVFYGSNSWAYTRLGRITNLTDAELTQLLSNGDVTITISMEE